MNRLWSMIAAVCAMAIPFSCASVVENSARSMNSNYNGYMERRTPEQAREDERNQRYFGNRKTMVDDSIRTEKELIRKVEATKRSD